MSSITSLRRPLWYRADVSSGPARLHARHIFVRLCLAVAAGMGPLLIGSNGGRSSAAVMKTVQRMNRLLSAI